MVHLLSVMCSENFRNWFFTPTPPRVTENDLDGKIYGHKNKAKKDFRVTERGHEIAEYYAIKKITFFAASLRVTHLHKNLKTKVGIRVRVFSLMGIFKTIINC